jgi:AhpD family alkylhydroperoxidase
MAQRVNVRETHAEAYKTLRRLSAIVDRSGLSPIETHLIKVRTSQINSCVFCIDMHTKEALAIGETQERLLVLTAWREATVFSEKEKALLALAEEVTLIHQHGVSDATYHQAEQFFSPEQIGDIIMQVVVMSSFNRIAVSTQLHKQAVRELSHNLQTN